MQNKKLKAGTEADKRTAADSIPSASLEQNGLLSAAFSVEEGNKLIAEFMGMEFLSTHFDSHNYEQYSYSVSDDISKQVYGYIGATCFLSNEQFYTSWDWLMPVVEKIENLRFTIVLQKGLCQIFSDKHPYSDIEFATKSNNNETSKIKLCYETILEFIKWYNDNVASVGSR